MRLLITTVKKQKRALITGPSTDFRRVPATPEYPTPRLHTLNHNKQSNHIYSFSPKLVISEAITLGVGVGIDVDAAFPFTHSVRLSHVPRSDRHSHQQDDAHQHREHKQSSARHIGGGHFCDLLDARPSLFVLYFEHVGVAFLQTID